MKLLITYYVICFFLIQQRLLGHISGPSTMQILRETTQNQMNINKPVDDRDECEM